MRTKQSTTKNKSKKNINKKQNKSISSMYGYSYTRDGSPKNKVKRMLSIHTHERLATDYS